MFDVMSRVSSGGELSMIIRAKWPIACLRLRELYCENIHTDLQGV